MKNPIKQQVVAGSFRDPSGFLFFDSATLLRQINTVYKPHYEKLTQSGLYEKLIEKQLLIPHTEETARPSATEEGFLVIAPEKIPFISYPYEWSFEQLKDAALATLEIQKIALEYGMVLKDASAFNIQFLNARPIFIDTLSFEAYVEGDPWIAYQQFCRHFLAPLALMAMTDIRLNQLLKNYIDGIPLDLASKILPRRTWFSFGLLSHLHLHAKAQISYGDKKVEKAKAKVSKLAFRGLIDSLESTIKKLKGGISDTEWADYYNDTNYSDESFEQKKVLVKKFVAQVEPSSAWDVGANLGLFSRLISEQGVPTVAFDIDPSAVQKNYLMCKSKGEKDLLPLVFDLTNPSPDLGWANEERQSIGGREKPDVIMALALIHHLALSNNLPFEYIAKYFSNLTDHLIIEFVPKQDSQVIRLLQNREDIFPNYTQPQFEEAFQNYFSIQAFESISGTERTLYLMKKSS